MTDLYQYHGGEAEASCRFCWKPCQLLAIVIPVLPLRKGYQGRRRYVLRCEGCGSSTVLMEARTSAVLYRVNH